MNTTETKNLVIKVKTRDIPGANIGDVLQIFNNPGKRDPIEGTVLSNDGDEMELELNNPFKR